MLNPLQIGIDLVERGFVPDFITRSFIQRLCAERVKQASTREGKEEAAEFLKTLRLGPVALHPEKANEQHYELPPEFFELALGERRKYSCCYYEDSASTLDQAEVVALRKTCEHAELQNGQSILELGCGWGSLSLWMAERYPESEIVVVSNSTPQRLYIESQCRTRSLKNLKVVTADINDFTTSQRYDRVVSVEMFEHLHNYQEMLRRIASWLNPEGKLFVHHFCHKTSAYPFETEGAANWIGRYFFTGGVMPNENLLAGFDQDMTVTKNWVWNGAHYQKTSEDWLCRLDGRRKEVMPILARTYGPRDAERWFHRWRMFFLAVAELFGYDQGREWFVVHLLLEPLPVDASVVQTAGR